MEGKKTIETFIMELINNIEKTPNWPDVDIKTYSALINRLNDEKDRISEALTEAVMKQIHNKRYYLNYYSYLNNIYSHMPYYYRENVEKALIKVSKELNFLYDSDVTRFIKNLTVILMEFIIFDYYERRKKERNFDIFKKRPRLKAIFGQQPCTEDTTFQRIELIIRDFFSPDTKVLFVGDGDFCSLALKSLVDFEIHMLDIDREIITFIESKNMGIVTHNVNLAKGLPKELENYFDAVMLDPLWDIKGAEMFITPACSSMKKNKKSRLYTCICPVVTGDDHGKLQKMIIDKGLVFHEIIKHFNWYELHANKNYAELLGIFYKINKEYIKSDFLDASLSVPFATSDMYVLGFGSVKSEG